jgi:hypothetical protein
MTEVELPNPEELEQLREQSFTRKTALTTAVYAVCLAVVSLGGNNAAKDMTLAQQQSSDQWAFYQAKAMREVLYKIEKARLEDDLAERGPSLTPAAREHKEAFLASAAKEEARYEAEKKVIEDKARELEKERDKSRAKDPYFDFGEVLLQIAIVLASMSILTHARPIFYASLVSALVGFALGLNGYLLLFHVPGL